MNRIFKIIVIDKLGGKTIYPRLNLRTASKYAVRFIEEGHNAFIREMKDEFDI